MPAGRRNHHGDSRGICCANTSRAAFRRSGIAGGGAPPDPRRIFEDEDAGESEFPPGVLRSAGLSGPLARMRECLDGGDNPIFFDVMDHVANAGQDSEIRISDVPMQRHRMNAVIDRLVSFAVQNFHR